MWGLFWVWASLCSLWKFSVRSVCVFFLLACINYTNFFPSSLPPFCPSFFLFLLSHRPSCIPASVLNFLCLWGWPWILDLPQEGGGDLLGTGITDSTPSSSKGVDCLISSCASNVLGSLCLLPPCIILFPYSPAFPVLCHLPFSLMPFHCLVAFANERKHVQTWQNQMDGADDIMLGYRGP